ncbi:MAG: PDZ domain-containing protein [Syntrophales bacterium]
MEMKRRLVVIFIITFLLSSLTGILINFSAAAETQGSISIKDSSTYCGIFHVSQEPSLASSPMPYLGVYLESQTLKKSLPSYREAVYVSVEGVLRGSPAAKAGLQKDDVILSMNGKPTCRDAGGVEEAFRKTIEKLPVDTEIRMEVLRGEKILSLMARTAERPHHDQPEATHRDAPSCTGPPSLLESSLVANGALPLFQGIISGLYQRSNQLHNLDSPLEVPFHPLQLKEATYLLRHPLNAGVIAQEISRQLTEPLEEVDWKLDEVLRRAVLLTDEELPACVQPKEITFPALLQTIEEAAKQVREAMRGLTPEQQTLLREKALDQWNDPQWNAILELSSKVDRRALFKAFSSLVSFLRKDNMDKLKNDLLKRFKNREDPILFQAETSAGLVIVGGNRSKVYDKDAALILDLGGNNLYLNNAGGTRPDIPVAMVIDWGGHNRYIARDNFSQGAALFGGGFLIDLGGHSTFVALDGSQGAGLWGIGLLYHGDSSSVFLSRSISQGVGQMGVGLLVGREGHDSYSCLYGGQAFGLYGGAGILINKGGNNTYRLGGLRPDFRDPQKSTVSMGQGFGYGWRTDGDKKGVPGGIGILIDEKGDDTFIADYFAQGSSYYYGIGILDNRGGNNRYIAGRYAQGAGIHTAIGVLLNRGGKSTYFTSYGVSQGMGHDYGVGFLQDDKGESEFKGGVLVQGAATQGGLGILADLGKKSRFVSDSSGQGFAKEEDCLGILISPKIQEDNNLTHSGRMAVRIGRKQDSMEK